MKSVNLVSLNPGPNKGRVEVEQVPGAKQAVACLFQSRGAATCNLDLPGAYWSPVSTHGFEQGHSVFDFQHAAVG